MARPARMAHQLPATVLVAALVAVSVAACGGGAKTASLTTNGGGAGSSGGAASNVAHFCRDYKEAAFRFSLAAGDVTDPDFAKFMTALTQAKAEAPSAVKGDATTMLDLAKSALSGKTVDLTTPSSRVSAWADTNCAGDTSDTSGLGDTSGLASSSPSPEASSSVTPEASSSVATAGSASAEFCSDASTVTYAIAGLADQTDGATSDWQAADTSVQRLAGEAPATVLQGPWTTQGGLDSASVQLIVSALAADVDYIANNGQGGNSASVRVVQDNTNVQTAAQRVC